MFSTPPPSANHLQFITDHRIGSQTQIGICVKTSVEAVLDRVRTTDDFKFNVNLVLIDLFQRLGMISST